MNGKVRHRRWAAIRGVASRDLLEFIRDRRTLFVTLLMPMAMYPILALASTLGLRTALADLDAKQAPQPIVVVLSGDDAEAIAQRIMKVARGSDGSSPDWPAMVTVEPVGPVDAKRRLDTGSADTWIHLPPSAAETLDGQGTLALNVRLANARVNDARLRRHILTLVKAVAEDARRRRVAAAGLPEGLLEPITVRFADKEVAARAPALDGVFPSAVAAVLVLLALLTATGGFYPAIDAIAGEKERGTIETLLITPASTLDIVRGKFLAVFAVTLVSLAANALSVALTAAVLLRLLPDGMDLGISRHAAVSCAATTLAAFVGLAAVAAAACLAVTSAARSTKEAQNALTPVILLTSGLAGSALVPGVGGPFVAMVPFAGQVSVAREALVGETDWPISLLLLLSLTASAITTWILLRAAAAALADEEILFRGPDSAGSLTARPAPRDVPTPMQGFAVALAALALLWYAQGVAPADPTFAIPIPQGALLATLAVMAVWQRVNRWRTFRIVWPGNVARGGLMLVAAAFLGAGLAVLGATLLHAVRGADLSGSARVMAEQIVKLLLARPWWVGWLLIVILPAICEELFFRGWMLSAFAGKRPSRGRAVSAVLVQAAAFAAFHLIPEKLPQTFVLGAVLGWMTLATGSLLPGIVAHAAHNAVPLVFLAVAGRERLAHGSVAGVPVQIWVSALAAVVVGFAVIRAASTKRE